MPILINIQINLNEIFNNFFFLNRKVIKSVTMKDGPRPGQLGIK